MNEKAKVAAGAVVAAAIAGALLLARGKPDDVEPPKPPAHVDPGYTQQTPLLCPDGVTFVARMEDCFP